MLDVCCCNNVRLRNLEIAGDVVLVAQILLCGEIQMRESIIVRLKVRVSFEYSNSIFTNAEFRTKKYCSKFSIYVCTRNYVHFGGITISKTSCTIYSKERQILLFCHQISISDSILEPLCQRLILHIFVRETLVTNIA